MLDMSEIITDPEFTDLFSVQRQKQVVGEDGIVSSIVITYEDVVGVIVSEGHDWAQDADFARATNSLTIITEFKLFDPTEGYQADVVVYDRLSYRVRKVANWRRWGFFQAECDMINLAGSVR